MSHFTSKSKHFLSIIPLAAIVFLSACSDESTNEVVTQTATAAKTIVGNSKNMTENKIEDKAHYKTMSKPVDKASWVEKGKFNKEFKKDCIAREMNNVGKDKLDRGFVEKTCDCIADYMDDHLTDQEAEEFLKEDSHMRALQIRYDTAAFQCIKGADKVSEPKITRFQ